MTSISIALLQISSHNDPEINWVKGEVYCRRAQALGADLALFPELWNIGYRLYDPHSSLTLEDWSAQAVSLEHAFVLQYRSLAKALNMAIGLTFLERTPGKPRNTLALIDRRGEIVLTYAKVHTCDFDQEIHLAAGESFPVCNLDFGAGSVRVGAMICYDREFPEPARILMLHGAEIILVPNACEMEVNRSCQLRTRAFENMVGVALANYPTPQNNGHSVAYSGMAFDQNEQPLDMTLVEAGEEEGIWLATFDLEKLRAYREHEVWGNAFRKPHLYHALTQADVTDPFLRARAQR